MLLELHPFQTELFCIARPRVRPEASFFADFWDVRVFWGVPWEPFWYRSLLKKCFRKKSAKLSENGSRDEFLPGPAESLKQKNWQLQISEDLRNQEGCPGHASRAWGTVADMIIWLYYHIICSYYHLNKLLYYYSIILLYHYIIICLY